MQRTWEFPSSSGSKTYITTIHPDGHFGCQCVAWRIKKKDKHRSCKHIKMVIEQFGLKVEVRGDYEFFVEEGETQTPVEPVKVAPPTTPSSSTGYIEPQLATAMSTGKTIEDFDPAEWVLEEKFDGHRAIVAVSVIEGNKDVQAWSRPRAGTRQGLKRVLPAHVVAALKFLPSGTYDSEIMGKKGGKSYDVTAGSNAGSEYLVLFDCLRIVIGDKENILTSKPFIERRAILEIAFGAIEYELKANSDVNLLDSVSISKLLELKKETIDEIWARGDEGAILKKKDSKYQSGGRPETWIKIKKLQAATLTVTGYKKGENGPYSAINLKDEEGCETRVKTKNTQWLKIFEKDAEKYIGRRLVIAFNERTANGGYREPRFDHFLEE